MTQAAVRVRVQQAPFDLAEETHRMSAGRSDIGALASFVGLVRDHNQVGDQEGAVMTLTLEHYPGMTEKVLEKLAAEAAERWVLQAVSIIHRVGELAPGDPIVLVLVASAHRHDAFEACQYLMDILKTEAPFWKKERLPNGVERWVDARETDAQAAARWEHDPH